jgi:hypothetical protein
MSDIAASIEVLFFAVPPTMNPTKRMAFPPTMNHRRPNKSLLAPHTIKAIVTVIVYRETYQAALVGSPSCVATTAPHALSDGTIQKLIPYDMDKILDDVSNDDEVEVGVDSQQQHTMSSK